MKRTALMSGNDIHLRFGGLQVLEDVSFALQEGQVLGVVGPNGAGKTALLNCICGVYRPQSGSIVLHGQEINGSRPETIARMGIGRTFQGMDHFRDFLVDDYVMLGCTHKLRSSCIGSFLALPRIDRNENSGRALVHDVLANCELSNYARKRLREIPYGIQKRVDMARVLASDCVVAILDEPTSGVTTSERESVSRSLEMLVERGISVMLIDHDVQFVTRHCDSLLALNSGRVLASGNPSSVLSDESVRSAFLGLAI